MLPDSLRFWIRICLSACLGLPLFASHALAQREQMGIVDQPGLVPDPADEQLPTQFQRQLVLYRSTEAPGTIIVHTSERFLYVVQPNGRALRYASGWGAMDSSGRACCASRASRSGRTGRRPPR